MLRKEDLIIGYLLESLSNDEKREVESRLINDSDFLTEFEAYKSIWEMSANVMPETQFDPAASWDALQPAPAVLRPMFSLSSKWIYRVAAVVLLVLSSMFFIQRISPTRFDSGLVYENQAGQNLYGLKDGSVVLLDEATQIDLHKSFNLAKREVKMSEGTGFFDIAKDQNRPFHIFMPIGEIVVKGTSFLVKSENHSTYVAVSTGIVDVLLDSQTWTLRAGDEITCTRDGGVIVRNAWDKQSLKTLVHELDNFYDTPLKHIVDYLRQSRDIDVAIPNNIENERFTVQLRGLSNEEILETLSKVTGLSLYQTGANYSLK